MVSRPRGRCICMVMQCCRMLLSSDHACMQATACWLYGQESTLAQVLSLRLVAKLLLCTVCRLSGGSQADQLSCAHDVLGPAYPLICGPIACTQHTLAAGVLL